MATPSFLTGIMLRIGALCLLLAVLAPTVLGAPVQYLPEKQTIVLFPVKNSVGQDKVNIGDDLMVMLKDGLSLTGRFVVVAYDVDRNVSVQRAIAEQKVKEAEVRTAFSTDPQGIARAQKVCQAIAADLGVIASIDSYSFNEAAREAKIGVTVQVLRGAFEAQPVTIAVTGIGVGKPDDQSQTESGIAIAAMDNAADKILARMLDAAKVTVSRDAPASQVQVYGPPQKERSNNKGMLAAMVGALLLGLALGGK